MTIPSASTHPPCGKPMKGLSASLAMLFAYLCFLARFGATARTGFSAVEICLACAHHARHVRRAEGGAAYQALSPQRRRLVDVMDTLPSPACVEPLTGVAVRVNDAPLTLTDKV
jgi:hypothetical protein